jgi:hypothetical protein
MSSFRSRVGERWKCDAAISLEQMLALQDLFAEEWHEATIDNDLDDKRETLACLRMKSTS